MKVTLRLSKTLAAIYKDLPEAIEVELPQGATVKDALKAGGLPQGIWGILLCGDRVCTTDHSLSPGDEITILPPVSGG